ncbi:NTP transferase domain-containing protein, partial [Candidatus Roizmanbacteria bacterium]|nr:NTP transferase domain-containing protein [Candidatus Roizmanbacteria bacterium]
SVVSNVPKPMADINGKPFLEYLLHFLSTNGVKKVILSVGYKHNIISSYFSDRFENLAICYAIENEPLGTGGALVESLKQVSDSKVLLLNGDSFFNVDVKRLYQHHKSHGFDVTLALKEMYDFDRYGTVTFEKNKVICFEEKVYKKVGYINGGVYALNSSLLADIAHSKTFSFETDILQKYVSKLNVGAFVDNGYFIDIGIPEDYLKVQQDFKLTQE